MWQPWLKGTLTQKSEIFLMPLTLQRVSLLSMSSRYIFGSSAIRV